MEELNVKKESEESNLASATPRERLCRKLQNLCQNDQDYIKIAMRSRLASIKIDRIKECKKEPQSLFEICDEHLIEVLSEALYFEVLAYAYKLKADAANSEHETAMSRFWDLIYSIIDREDDENMHLDLTKMQIVEGKAKKRLEMLKEEMYSIIRAGGNDLRQMRELYGMDSLRGELVKELLGKNREKVINLIETLFEANNEDMSRSVICNDETPIFLNPLAECILNLMKKKL